MDVKLVHLYDQSTDWVNEEKVLNVNITVVSVVILTYTGYFHFLIVDRSPF